ncbi:acyltransferase family protein [Aestuariivivens sediminicola]|uniref:acyltransferase family protein n=1 Tax=Aestuariivivens sediminicola TaxID=2913560 RepID=UPI001F58FD7C|nr:acyltransferase [Aestuariivivens sediminicola]
MNQKSKRIYGLDLVRAIAITLVLLSHTNYIFQGYDIQGVQLFGVQGVEIFFVLSGFLIGGLLLRLINSTSFEVTDVLYFWVRRWFRTLPLYFLMLFVNVLVALWIGYELPSNLWKYLFFLQNFYDSHILFFPESWSLSVEEYAYILAPLCLTVSFRLLNKFFTRDTLFLGVSVFLVLLFFVFKVKYNSSVNNGLQSLSIWNTNLKAIVIYRLDAIFYGFILVALFKRFRIQIERKKIILFNFGLGLSFLVMVVIPYLGFSIENYPFYWNVLYLPVNSIGISLALPMFYFLKKPSGVWPKLVKKISLYSYAMYLIHYTFILYLMQLVLDFKALKIWQRIACVLFYLGITYFGSKFIYNYFEKPCTGLRDSFRIKQLFKQ